MQVRAKALMIGLVLGDGHLARSFGRSTKSILELKYDERYLGYLEWIHKELGELSPSPIRKKKGYHQYRFYTKAREDVGELRRLFYPDGTKRIPEDIKKYLEDPLTLAIWYQDDGTLDFRKNYHANALFATHCFTRRECDLLAEALKANFDLDVRVCRCMMRGKLSFRLYVTSKSMQKFMDIIDPYMLECFHYKFLDIDDSSQQQR